MTHLVSLDCHQVICVPLNISRSAFDIATDTVVVVSLLSVSRNMTTCTSYDVNRDISFRIAR